MWITGADGDPERDLGEFLLRERSRLSTLLYEGDFEPDLDLDFDTDFDLGGSFSLN